MFIRWCSECKAMRPHNYADGMPGSPGDSHCLVCAKEMQAEAPEANIAPIDELWLESQHFTAKEIGWLRYYRHLYLAGAIPGDDAPLHSLTEVEV